MSWGVWSARLIMLSHAFPGVCFFFLVLASYISPFLFFSKQRIVRKANCCWWCCWWCHLAVLQTKQKQKKTIKIIAEVNIIQYPLTLFCLRGFREDIPLTIVSSKLDPEIISNFFLKVFNMSCCRSWISREIFSWLNKCCLIWSQLNLDCCIYVL